MQYGGHQGDRLMFEVKGEASARAVEALRARFEHRVTRVDSCADFDAPDAFKRLLKACTAIRRSTGSWAERLGTGTISRRRAARFTSVAPQALSVHGSTKGLQPEYAHLNRPDWTRIEAQIRPKGTEAKEAFSKLSPIEVWGAGKWTRDIAAAVLHQHVDPHPAGSTYRLSERETALRWMCKQYGAHLVSLAADLGGWDCVGLTLSEIMQEQAKGR